MRGICARWPSPAGFHTCYDGGPVDLGEAVWRRLDAHGRGLHHRRGLSPGGRYLSLSTTLTQKENDDMGIKIEQTTF